MDFETTFKLWLTAAFNSPIGDEVKAFAFNLYEPSGDPNVKFGVELIGAGIFDEDDWIGHAKKYGSRKLAGSTFQ